MTAESLIYLLVMASESCDTTDFCIGLQIIPTVLLSFSPICNPSNWNFCFTPHVILLPLGYQWPYGPLSCSYVKEKIPVVSSIKLWLHKALLPGYSVVIQTVILPSFEALISHASHFLKSSWFIL